MAVIAFVRAHKVAVVVASLAVIGIIVGTTLGILLTKNKSSERSFGIDYDKNTFIMDGKSWQYVAGSFHYFRSHPNSWRAKLRTMKAGGLVAVDLYIQWSLHNPEDGVYNWDGIADVVEVVKIAKEEELFVILRPGPYICAEIDNGGIPYWLANKYPNIKVRTSDVSYLREVKKWYEVLMPKFEQYLFIYGGNIIMVQIENEYGAFKLCDKEYLNFLKNETTKHVHETILFTTDRPFDKELECGQIDGVFVTTDFGIHTKAEVDDNFRRLREVQPNGPLVNSEFYTGWLTHWQEGYAQRNANELAATLDYMLYLGTNVNFYMYHGGTNFGFWAGANDWGVGQYMADISSYDYDAPMSESGDPTEKYRILRDVIHKHIPISQNLIVPQTTTKIKLQTINLRAVGTIMSQTGRNILGTKEFFSKDLMSFEQLELFSGFVLYETDLPKFTRDPSNLLIEKLRDRGLVYIDGNFVGALSRENNINTIPISSQFGKRLQILVENQGRINFQIADDYKGILGSVMLQTFTSDFFALNDWSITGYPFDNYGKLQNFISGTETTYEFNENGVLEEGPIIFTGEFSINENNLYDTYWNTSGWGKGFIFINGFNLGRYWPLVGPQITMYISREFLKVGNNEIVIVELQKASGVMEFSDIAIFM